MTWEQLSDQITTMMLSGQLRDPIQFDATAVVAIAVALGSGEEEAPEELVVATGVKNGPAKLKDVGGGRMARNDRES